MPAGRVSVSVFVPPVKVGVAPSTLPAALATVTLCGSGELLVQLRQVTGTGHRHPVVTAEVSDLAFDTPFS